MSNKYANWGVCAIAGAWSLLEATALCPSVFAAPNGSDTWAGDFSTGFLPAGTVMALQYGSFSHASEFISPSGAKVPNSNIDVYSEYQRFVYYSSLLGEKVVFEAAIPAVSFDNATLGGLPVTHSNGLADPVLFFVVFPVEDFKAQRIVGVANYFNIPVGKYDNTKTLNPGSPDIFVWTPELGYTEGLAKFGLPKTYFDVVFNTSFHSDGENPTPNYKTANVDVSYQLRLFLRYDYNAIGFAALGVEKTWGGKETYTDSVLPDVVMSEASRTRGHLQLAAPLSDNMQLAADFYHDFETSGGFRSDFGVELRLAAFRVPTKAPIK